MATSAMLTSGVKVTVTRSNPSMSEATPCPSLMISSMKGNSSGPSATGSPTPAPFTGAANHIAASAGVVMAAVAVALAL